MSNYGTEHSPCENNVDSIEIQESQKVYEVDPSAKEASLEPVSFDLWLTHSREVAGDSFFDIGDAYKTWSAEDAITYLEACNDWHTKITNPLANFLLEVYPDRITHEVHNMYDLAVDIMKATKLPTQTFLDWQLSYIGGDFVMLSSTQIELLHKEELQSYLNAEREKYQELNRPLYEFVMNNHNERIMQCGTIQAAILDMLKNQ